LAIIIGSFLPVLFFLKKKESIKEEELKETKERLKKDEIFALGPALKFAVIFLLIRIVTKTSLALFGNKGFLVTIGIASITGIDAVTINLSELAGTAVSFKTGVLALILANAVNLLGKTVYSFTQGKKEFALNLL